MIQVADDVTAFGQGENAFSQADKIVKRFKQINQTMDGVKMKIIVPPNYSMSQVQTFLQKYPRFSQAPIVFDSYPTLGGVISPRVSTLENFQEAVSNKLLKLRQRVTQVKKLQGSIQCKLIVLRALARTLVYYCQTFISTHAASFFEEADSIILEAFKTITGIEGDGSNRERIDSCIFKPIEDGGLGFFPYLPTHMEIQEISIQQTEDYTNCLGLTPLPQCSKPTSVKSHNTIWKRHLPAVRVDKDGRSYSRFTAPNFHSWLHLRPLNSISTLPDDIVRHQLNVILHNLTPTEGSCLQDNGDVIEYRHMSRSEYTHHLLSCARCSNRGFHMRHESVVSAIRMTNKFFSVNCFIPNQWELPLPGKEKGGPDVVVMAGEQMDAVDVTVVHIPDPQGKSLERDFLAKRFNDKKTKYSGFATMTKMNVIPFVVSIYGIIATETRGLLGQWQKAAADPRYISDLFNNVQCYLIKSLFHFSQIQNYKMTSQTATVLSAASVHSNLNLNQVTHNNNLNQGTHNNQPVHNNHVVQTPCKFQLLGNN